MSNEGFAERAEILPLMGVVRRSGEWMMAMCPVHADGAKHNGKAGQSLGLSDTGVLKCFAGCDFSDLMAALRKNRSASDNLPQPDHGRARESAWPLQPVATYDYGVAVKARFERPATDGAKPEKTFRWRLPEGTYKDGLNGLPMTAIPLWDATDIASAPTDRRVWFAEGESATAAIRARNELATCGPWGASQRDFGSALEVLRGRDVILFPDNDVPGRDYMAAIRRELLPIARSVATVSAPVPPKGDAVEFFQSGGSLDDLLAGVLLRTTVDVLGPDHMLVRVPTVAGEIAFDIDALVEQRRDLQCHITIDWKIPAAPRAWTQHLNLESPSGCEGLARALGKHFKDAGVSWLSLLNDVKREVRDGLASVDISDYSEPDINARPAELVVQHPPIPRDGGTVVHGQPKGGKSQLGLAVAIALDADLRRSIFGVSRHMATCYINLERSKQSMLARTARVNLALGLDSSRPIRFIHARGQGLASILPRVRKVIRDYGIEFVVLDSISRGGFGNLNGNEEGNAWIDAMNSLGVTWLAIGHEPRPTKEGGPPHLFGSLMQDAGADAVVSLISKPADANRLLVSLNVTAANDFARPAPFDLVYEFDDDGLTSMRRAGDDERADLEEVKVLSVRQQVLASLRDEGAATPGDLSKRLSKLRPNISRELANLSREGLVTKGKDDYWELLPAAYQPSNIDTYRDTGPVSLAPLNTPPRGGSSLDTADTPGEMVTCSSCGRDNVRLAGYHPDSTPEIEMPLCPSCADESLQTLRGAS